MLLIPVRDSSGTVQSLQYIAPDGTKRFLTGGKVQGGQFVIPGNAEKPLALCEGYATGASIHLACAWTVYVTFSAGNLPVVAAAVRKQFPDAQILICGDNDETGRDKGQEAAQTAQAHLVVPHFTTGSGKDFNDLHLTEGLQSVRRQLESVLPDKPPSLVSLDMGEFLSMSIPERGYLLSPVLPVQGIGILYAPRGIGKTFAALSVAVAMASGGAVFNWRAPHAQTDAVCGRRNARHSHATSPCRACQRHVRPAAYTEKYGAHHSGPAALSHAGSLHRAGAGHTGTIPERRGYGRAG